MAVGILLLGYCGLVLLDTRICENYQNIRFEEQLSSVRTQTAEVGGVSDLPVAPIPRGALGRIEIPKIGIAALILEVTSGRTLRRAVGHIPGTPLPGQQGMSPLQDTGTLFSGSCAMLMTTMKSR
jgi:sortase (surface protein transpeptidase)